MNLSNRFPRKQKAFARNVFARIARQGLDAWVGYGASAICAVLFSSTVPAATAAQSLDYKLDLQVVRSGFDGETCWAQARAGTIPGNRPVVVLTMQKTLLSASDVYYALNEMRTDDLGRTWTGPVEHETLGRHTEADGSISAIADFTPKWHAASRKLLGTGASSHTMNEKKLDDPPSQVGYSVYDEARHVWTPWQVLELPDGRKSHHIASGCSQRLDLPDGTILLPVYFKAKGVNAYSTTILRCSFDGRTLKYLSHGNELSFPFDPATIQKSLSPGRRFFDARQAGLFEPSLTRFQDVYYLTLRNRHAGYVAISKDGRNFSTPRVWTFDDGDLVGNYNTQQHWVSHSNGLYLTYTRRGVGNDHVFRHRAPILMARVDPVRICLIRSTERILIPEKGVDIGNFAVTDVTPNETWVTTTEMMFNRPDSPPPDALARLFHTRTDFSIFSRKGCRSEGSPSCFSS